MLSKDSHTMVAIILATACSTKLQADIIVVGSETGPGAAAGDSIYSFTLQGDGAGPVITIPTTSVPMSIEFAIDGLPGGVTIFTPSGTITDGTNTLTATLFGWTGGATTPDLDLGLVADVVTLEAAAGADISSLTWRFEREGADLTGAVLTTLPPAAVPEPGSFALLGMIAIGGLYRYRRRACDHQTTNH